MQKYSEVLSPAAFWISGTVSAPIICLSCSGIELSFQLFCLVVE
jgi:hypothetical protein